MPKNEDHLNKIVIPGNHPNPPEPHEIEIAKLLVDHFGYIVEFIIPIDGYKIKTADIVMNGLLWEIKSPIGKSRRHLVNAQFDRASKQSKNIIFDGRRTPLDDEFMMKQIRFEISRRSSLRRVIFITKSEIIVEMK
jgi:hypothetical protein